MMKTGEWFRVLSGGHAGQWHMAGWMLSAIKGEPTGPRDDGWLAYGNCPRCYAMVCADTKNPFGDLTWAHEQWPARTDYPTPDGYPDPEPA
jgi:hypothetical protein